MLRHLRRGVLAAVIAAFAAVSVFSVPASAGGWDSITANPANAPLLLDPNLTGTAASAASSIVTGGSVGSNAISGATTFYTAAATTVPGSITAGSFATSLASGVVTGGGYGTTAAAVAGQGVATAEATTAGLSLGSAIFGGAGTSAALLLGGVSTWQLAVAAAANGGTSGLPTGTAPTSATFSGSSTSMTAANLNGASLDRGAASPGIVGAFTFTGTGTVPAGFYYGSVATTFTFALPYTVTTPMITGHSYASNVQSQYGCINNGALTINAGVSTSGFIAAGTTSGTVSVGASSGGCGASVTDGLQWIRFRSAASLDYASGSVTTWGPWAYIIPPGAPLLTNAVPRWIEQTVTCTTSGGTTHTITNSTASEVWSPGDMKTVAGLMCPDGERQTGWTSKVKTTGGSDVPLGRTASNVGTSVIPRGCDLAAAHCTLDLVYTATSTSTPTSCFSTASIACADWTTVAKTQTSTSYPRYDCRYGNGGTVAWAGVALTDCVIYANVWKTGSLTDPAPPPSTTSSSPSGSGSTSDSCWSGTFSWNPLDWVLTPVKCALSWAFVPDTATMESAGTTLSTAWNSSPPGTAAAGVTTLSAPFTGLASAGTPDCLGPDVTLHVISGAVWIDHMHPFANCDGFPKMMGDYLRPILTAVFLLMGFGQGVRSIVSTIGLGTPKSVAP